VSVADPLPPRRTTTRTAILAFVVILATFAAGVLAGVAIDRRMHRNPPPPFMVEAMLHRLDRRLDLTDQQRDTIEQIIQRRHARMSRLFAHVRPQMDAEIAATNAEIERVLTPEQREKFQKMRMRLGPRHGRHRGKERKEPTR
jgi:Spy/CpxP family protein refolding chaperone